MLDETRKYGCLTILDFGNEYQSLNPTSDDKNIHYKCICNKCGMIHYYNESTLLQNPKYCAYPIAISAGDTYSISAKNATYRKRQKYKDNECVILTDKKDCRPAPQYCGAWNNENQKKRDTKLREKADIIATLPRHYAKNYDSDYVGLQYDSLYIQSVKQIEYGSYKIQGNEISPYLDQTLTNVSFNVEHLPEELIDIPKNRIGRSVTIYKVYTCKCCLCGKEQDILCDKFGINPRTSYGYHAYHGYWSDVSCDCRGKTSPVISSFQWLVNKVLFENRILYTVEYSYSDLIGAGGKNKLAFDFAIFNPDKSIKCLIECQGKQHFEPVPEFGGKAAFDLQQKNDELKRQYTQIHGLPLIEISYQQKNIKDIKNILKAAKII